MLDWCNTPYFMSYIDRVATFVAQFWGLNHSSLLVAKRFSHLNANIVAMIPASIRWCIFPLTSILILFIKSSGTILHCKWLLMLLLSYLDSNFASSSIYSCQHRCLRLIWALFLVVIVIVSCCIIWGGQLWRCDIFEVPWSVILLLLFIVVLIRSIFVIFIVWITAGIKFVICVGNFTILRLSSPVGEFLLLVASNPWMIENFYHRQSISFLILK